MPGQPRNLDLSQFTGNQSGFFAGAEFRVNDGLKRADAWFVFEDADPEDAECEVPPNQVHFLSAEGSWRSDKFLSPIFLNFAAQFATVNTCHPSSSPKTVFSPPFLPWMVNANHESIFVPHERDIAYLQDLSFVEKDRPLSIFCSAQNWTPEHRLRFAFAEHLKQYFGDDITWFGNGVNSLPEKWDGLAPFERTIVLENRSAHTNFTEKILDPFLSLTTPIYWGAPNINEYLPVPKDHQINVHSFHDATQKIRQIIRKPPTQSDQDRLLQGRKLVLGERHFLQRIARIARDHHDIDSKHELVTLHPKGAFIPPPPKESWSTGVRKLVRRVGARKQHKVASP